ncbi:iron uptake porin [Synechococcus sp. FACHB-909]|uniref:iron uptake porin n=1 Tax=Synechococcus sp. FACHB-909 TaxID=2692863 RepID=UPI001681D445|nr:iron uptake porin [Synechococcus sp. FACHB-909]MBD2720461.1 carbohydrate porin [Synechococcus sp. FACHB-909]
MKPFQQFLLAPVALGLLSPLAASAGEISQSQRAEISTYMEQQDIDRFKAWEAQNQVTSINQFSDVKPTDWAFQALSNLVERYGCVAGYPNGTFKGGQAMTRYEAAALLNACLDRITEVTDELKRLMDEFEKELAVLRGRVDGLEAKVGELEATQFSTTTKLQGDAVFVIGANSFGGNQGLPNPAVGVPAGAANAFPANNRRNWGATVFNYDLRLNLLTSFTGKDLLYTRLRSGNFNNSPFGGQPYNLMALDRAFSPVGGADVVNIDRLYYRFPIGRDFTALIGARARKTEFLAITPWFYRSEILDVFTLHGAPGTYNKATGSTFGLMWKQNVKKGKPFFAISTAYVAPNGDNGNPNQGGLLNERSRGTWTTQAGVAGKNWRFAFAWSYVQCGQNFRRGTTFAQAAVDCPNINNNFLGSENFGTSAAYSNNFATTFAWQPKKSGWIPSINLGWGYNAMTQPQLNPQTALIGRGATAIRVPTFDTVPTFNQSANRGASQSWSVGLQWNDVFMKGNQAGMAVGQPVFATSLRNGQTPQDGNFAWEWWYKFQVTDNISVTPALFYLSRPNGQFTTIGQSSSVLGGLIQTQFRF